MSVNPSLVCTGNTYWNNCWNYCVSCTGRWNVTGCACQGSPASMSYSSYSGVTTLTEIPVLNYTTVDTTVPSIITALPNYEYFPPDILLMATTKCVVINGITGAQTFPSYMINGGAPNIKYNVQLNGIDASNNSTFTYQGSVSPSQTVQVLSGLSFITNTAAAGGNYQYENEQLNVSATYVDPTYGYTYPMGYNIPLQNVTWLPDCANTGATSQTTGTGGFIFTANSGICIGPGGCTYSGQFSFGGSGNAAKSYSVSITANYSNGTYATLTYPRANPSIYNFEVYTANNIYDQYNNLYVTGNPPKVQLTLYYINNSDSNDYGYLVTGIQLPICNSSNPLGATSTSTGTSACSYCVYGPSNAYMPFLSGYANYFPYYLNRTTSQNVNFTTGWTGWQFNPDGIVSYANISGSYSSTYYETYTPTVATSCSYSSTYSGDSNFSGNYLGNDNVTIIYTYICNSKQKSNGTWTGNLHIDNYIDGGGNLTYPTINNYSNTPIYHPCSLNVDGSPYLYNYRNQNNQTASAGPYYYNGVWYNTPPINGAPVLTSNNHLPSRITYANPCNCLCPAGYAASPPGLTTGTCVYVG